VTARVWSSLSLNYNTKGYVKWNRKRVDGKINGYEVCVACGYWKNPFRNILDTFNRSKKLLSVSTLKKCRTLEIINVEFRVEIFVTLFIPLRIFLNPNHNEMSFPTT
jgi:hypothetical protein